MAAVGAIRLEEVRHLVVGDPVARQADADQVRQVVVAPWNGIGVTEGTAADLGGLGRAIPLRVDAGQMPVPRGDRCPLPTRPVAMARRPGKLRCASLTAA